MDEARNRGRTCAAIVFYRLDRSEDMEEARNRGWTCAAIVFYRLDRSEDTWLTREMTSEPFPGYTMPLTYALTAAISPA